MSWADYASRLYWKAVAKPSNQLNTGVSYSSSNVHLRSTAVFSLDQWPLHLEEVQTIESFKIHQCRHVCVHGKDNVLWFVSKNSWKFQLLFRSVTIMPLSQKMAMIMFAVCRSFFAYEWTANDLWSIFQAFKKPISNNMTSLLPEILHFVNSCFGLAALLVNTPNSSNLGWQTLRPAPILAHFESY